jgi:hypothetical protein
VWHNRDKGAIGIAGRHAYHQSRSNFGRQAKVDEPYLPPYPGASTVTLAPIKLQEYSVGCCD